MPVSHYGVLTGRPIRRILGTAASPHYQIRVVDDSTDYRIAINIQSQDRSTPDLLFHIEQDFHHPIASELTSRLGFRGLESTPGGGGLDFIRGNLFDRDAMTIVREDDLNDDFEEIIQPAISDEKSLVYAFGQRWGPEVGKKDQYFGFLPGNGIHDIHMNQGNGGKFTQDDGIWQDGGLLVHNPSEDRWIAVFLKFQSRSWHTDDVHGHTIGQDSPAETVPAAPGGRRKPKPRTSGGHVRIVAARVHHGAASGGDVTVLNASPHEVDLNGWSVADRLKRKHKLHGKLAGGQAMTVPLKDAKLEPSGGLISLLDPKGLKVDGVAYTADQAGVPGWSIVF
jgi:uncharacterized protein YukJ